MISMHCLTEVIVSRREIVQLRPVRGNATADATHVREMKLLSLTQGLIAIIAVRRPLFCPVRDSLLCDMAFKWKWSQEHQKS